MNEQTNIFALTKQDTAVLKGIAIIAMLMHHLWGCPPEWVAPYTGVLGFFGNVGKVCVAIFLFCSGYGLSVGYSKVVDGLQCTMHDCKKGFIDTLKFLANRFVKFYAGFWPIFFIFVPISIFGFGRTFDVAYGANYCILSILKDLFSIPGAPSYNITWWFNKLIVLFYLCFPLTYICARKIPVLTLLLCMAITRFSGHIDYEICQDFSLYIFPFVLGMVMEIKNNVLCKASQWLGNHKTIGVICSLMLLVFAFFMRVNEYLPHFSGSIRWDGVLTATIVICYCITRAASHKSLIVLPYLGKHSMNTYLIHTFFFGYWVPWVFYSSELGGGYEYSCPSHYLFVYEYPD